MQSKKIKIAFPKELIKVLDQKKETEFQKVSYDEMLSSLIECGLELLKREKKQQTEKDNGIRKKRLK